MADVVDTTSGDEIGGAKNTQPPGNRWQRWRRANAICDPSTDRPRRLFEAPRRLRLRLREAARGQERPGQERQGQQQQHRQQQVVAVRQRKGCKSNCNLPPDCCCAKSFHLARGTNPTSCGNATPVARPALVRREHHVRHHLRPAGIVNKTRCRRTNEQVPSGTCCRFPSGQAAGCHPTTCPARAEPNFGSLSKSSACLASVTCCCSSSQPLFGLQLGTRPTTGCSFHLSAQVTKSAAASQVRNGLKTKIKTEREESFWSAERKFVGREASF